MPGRLFSWAFTPTLRPAAWEQRVGAGSQRSHVGALPCSSHSIRDLDQAAQGGFIQTHAHAHVCVHTITQTHTHTNTHMHSHTNILQINPSDKQEKRGVETTQTGHVSNAASGVYGDVWLEMRQDRWDSRHPVPKSTEPPLVFYSDSLHKPSF